MTATLVLGITRDALYTALEVAAPILGAALLVGLVVSLLQAATQVSEPTVGFVPKVLAIAGVLLLAGPWMLMMLTDFTRRMLQMLPDITR